MKLKFNIELIAGRIDNFHKGKHLLFTKANLFSLSQTHDAGIIRQLTHLNPQ